MDNGFVENNLHDKEFPLLKTASKYSQFLDRTAGEFREMLTAREFNTPNVTYSEFIEKKELIRAINMRWLLGHDDDKKHQATFQVVCFPILNSFKPLPRNDSKSSLSTIAALVKF